MRAVIAVAVSVLLLGGCDGGGEGEQGGGDRERSDRRGFFRIDARAGEVAQVRGTMSAGRASAPVGTFLEVLATGYGKLIGSSHPDQSGALPPYQGLMKSADGGKRFVECFTPPGLLIDFDVDPDHAAATETRLVRSTNGGKTWTTAVRP